MLIGERSNAVSRYLYTMLDILNRCAASPKYLSIRLQGIGFCKAHDTVNQRYLHQRTCSAHLPHTGAMLC